MHTVTKCKYSQLPELSETWSLLGLKMLCSTGICPYIEFRLNSWRRWSEESGSSSVSLAVSLYTSCIHSAAVSVYPSVLCCSVGKP